MGAMGIGIDISRCSTLDWGSVLMGRVLMGLSVRSCGPPRAGPVRPMQVCEGRMHAHTHEYRIHK